jgi:hypothetical protein
VNVTAVVLTPGTYARRWPGLKQLVHRSTIRNAADLQRARFDTALAVQTPSFFFLDDDDDLPDDYLEVIEQCVDAGAPLAYTDELVNGERVLSGPYSQAEHLARPMLVHHLALYETQAARSAIAQLPRGHYAPEFMLAWQVARRGATYVPRVGYHWNRGNGMHAWPCTSLSWMRSMLWCKENP